MSQANAENGKLKISYIGYESQLISIDGKKTIEVSLIPSLKTLDEVVVTAFGTQKKVNVTGAISTVVSGASFCYLSGSLVRGA